MTNSLREKIELTIDLHVDISHDGRKWGLISDLEALIDQHTLETRIDELDKIKLDGNLLRIKNWVITRRHILNKELKALTQTKEE